ncbi:hypothetical protein P389DRAFT_168600 [Cystobasidium minutum MCA 4210]|uniref:uncharacterized protein n=1 Tax=Cystobasidium minutum MCA 4210 TaxID=1397322 RepID=UPI0034CF4D9E|eukprot:jgi/Rhomi1/168600/fgenesh1_kg.3_\
MSQSVFAGNQWTTASGSSWAVVIEPDFVNSVAELANHLALQSQDARSTSEKLVEKAQAQSAPDSGSSNGRKEVVKELIGVVAEGGLNQGAEARDIEGFVNLASALVKTLFKDSEEEIDQLLVQLAQGVAKPSSSNEGSATTHARYNALSSLFNALPESVTYQTRTSILLSLFKLAISKDDLSILTSALDALPSWVSSEWSISDSSVQDSIISQFVNLLEGAKEAEEANELVRKLLYTYTGQNTSDELKEKLLFYTLANTSSFHDVDLESLPRSGSNNALNALKDIFLSGTVADLESFFSNNGSDELVKKLDQEKLKEKLQYVILADYCAGSVGTDITYDQVAEVLGLKIEGDEEERAMQVEIWVIATIRVKLLKARLHQPSSTISILQASPRKFGAQQWELLQSRLENWKSSIANIQDTVGRALGGNQNAGARQGQRYDGQQRNTADAQELVNAHAEKAQETQQPVVEVA